MKIHASGEDYLEAVLVLQKKLGMVRSVDVARYMEVSKPSVCYAVGTLREGGFLTMDEKHYLHLTELGRDMAEKFTNAIVFLLINLYPLELIHKLQKLMLVVWNMQSVMKVFKN